MALTRLIASKLIGMNVQGDVGPLTLYTSSRGKIVYFDRAPPLTPATPAQLVYRNRFRAAAKAWQALTSQQRSTWQLCVDRAHCKLTGYNLWLWNQLKPSPQILATLQRQSRVTLEP